MVWGLGGTSKKYTLKIMCALLLIQSPRKFSLLAGIIKKINVCLLRSVPLLLHGFFIQFICYLERGINLYKSWYKSSQSMGNYNFTLFSVGLISSYPVLTTLLFEGFGELKLKRIIKELKIKFCQIPWECLPLWTKDCRMGWVGGNMIVLFNI